MTKSTEKTELQLGHSQFTPYQSHDASLLAVIASAAKNPAVDVEKMERLLAMQERVMARQSEEAFNNAMAACQQEMPRIVRDAVNPSTASRFARLETVNQEIIPIYGKHGFSLSFGSGECAIPDHYRITCVVAHKGGHSRNYQCDLPRDDMGPKDNRNKTKMHGAGSTFSYGRRYLTLLIFNISLVNEDDDGNRGNRPPPKGPSAKEPSDSQLKNLARELWELVKPIRGDAGNWDKANFWLWKEEILDAAAEERMPHNVSEKRLREAIEQAKNKLQNT